MAGLVMEPALSNEVGNRREEYLESWDTGSPEKGSGEPITDHGELYGNRLVGEEEEVRFLPEHEARWKSNMDSLNVSSGYLADTSDGYDGTSDSNIQNPTGGKKEHVLFSTH